jgi:hypothetical protein
MHVHWATGAIARLSPRPLLQPLAKASLDVFVAGFGMTPAKILTHQVDARLEQVERCSERLDDRNR